MEEEACKKFIMVDDNQGVDILPLHAQYITPPFVEPPIRDNKCERLIMHLMSMEWIILRKSLIGTTILYMNLMRMIRIVWLLLRPLLLIMIRT